MKIVYALISDETDFFYEQALMSVYSVRRTNPSAHIEIVTDEKTAAYISSRPDSFEPLIDDIKIIKTPENLPKKPASRYIKTNIRNYVTGDFLYIDVDTIMLREIKESDLNCQTSIGAVRHSHLKTVNFISLMNYWEISGKPHWRIDIYFNDGVIFVKDVPKSYNFYDSWHELWLDDYNKYGYDMDQPSFSQSVSRHKNVVSELRGEFNCQAETNNAKQYYFNTFIFHYFSGLNEDAIFPLKKPSILNKIRTNGITCDLENVIYNPQLYYFKKWNLKTQIDKDFYNTRMYGIAKKIYYMFHKRTI